MILIRTLGVAAIDSAAGVPITPQSMRKFALLLHLSAERGRRVSRGTLQELMYPGYTAKQSGHALRELVYQLRQAGVAVETDKHGLQLAAEAVRSDYSEVLERERPDEAQLRAVEGGFLPGYAPSHSEAYTEWFEGWKGRVTFELVKALLREMQRSRAAADLTRLELTARACLALDSLNEEATLALAEAMALSGAKAQAVGLLDAYIAEVGPVSGLHVPAGVLRRRIGERSGTQYASKHATPFLGRVEVMHQLDRAFAATKNGESSLVVLDGEPGIGKSRIISEFCALAELSGARVVRATADPTGAQRPMGGFIDLIPELIQTPGALGCAPESMAAVRTVTNQADLTSGLSEADDPKSTADRISAAIDDLLDAVCAEQALVIVLEDCHWLDSATWRLFFNLCARSKRRRLFGLASTRTVGALLDRSTESLRALRVTIRRLSNEASRDLARAALADADLQDDEIADWVAATSLGNPLFLTSIAQHFVTTRRRFEVPPDIRQLLINRINALSETELAVLSAIAILARQATVRRVLALLDMPLHAVVIAAQSLENAGFVQIEKEAVRVAHPLIAEALDAHGRAFASCILHQRAAQLLDEEAEVSASLLWDSAEHWVAAGEDERANRVFHRCAAHALSIGRPREAAQTLLRAASLRLEPATRDQTLASAAKAAQLGSEHELVLDVIDLMDRRIRVHDELELAEWSARAVTYRFDEGMEAKALECLSAHDASPEHRAGAASWVLKYADTHGRADVARQAFKCMRSIPPAAVPAHVATEFEMIYECAFGEPKACLRAAQRLLNQLADLSVHRRLSVTMNVGFALWHVGECDESLRIFHDVYAQSTALNSLRARMRCGFHLVQALVDLNRDAEVRHWIDVLNECRAQSPELADSFDTINGDLYISLTYGDLRTARELIREAIDQNRFSGGKLRDRWIRAYRVRFKQLSRRSPLKDAEMEGLLSTGEAEDAYVGLRDFEIAVAVAELTARGEANDALRLLERYRTNARRSRSPLCRILADAAIAAQAEAQPQQKRKPISLHASTRGPC